MTITDVRQKPTRGRGFVTIAQDNETTDYLRLAYALALSLKHSQTEYGRLTVLITPGMTVPDAYRKVFHKVVELPWDDGASNEIWKIHNKWKVFHVTPYEETIFVDADMLFTVDITNWWNLLRQREVWAATVPQTYRGTDILNSSYRNAFRLNGLPNLYSTLTYFKQGYVALEYFAMVHDILTNWEGYSDIHNLRRISQFLPESDEVFHYPDLPRASGDVAFSLAAKLMMDTHPELMSTSVYPTFVHMKTLDQEWDNPVQDDNWMNYTSVLLTEDVQLYIGNYKQILPFHYYRKDFLTDEIIGILEHANNI